MRVFLLRSIIIKNKKLKINYKKINNSKNFTHTLFSNIEPKYFII